ncbi:MAG: phosphoglycerate kinase [Ruminococcus sp.]|nr:phosphoglycerate kinase [Ruminococcus sp.]
MAGLNKVTVEDINVKGRKVLVRVDFNVPLKDGVITNDNRIQAALPTINKLVENGAKVVLCSHLGKPKNGPEAKFSLAPAAARLAELVDTKVVFAADDTVVGENAKKAVAEMADGEIVVLENTRFRGAEETKNGEDFSKELAELVDGEVFVMDAFGSAHRAHASTAGVTKFVKETAVGYLMQKEIKYLGNAVEVPERPFVAILGGAKVADKLNVISNLLEKCDTLIIGGGMAYTFIKANGGSIGKSLVDDEKLEYCKEMLAKAESLGKKILLPVDTAVAAEFPNPIDAEIEVENVASGEIPADKMGLDIGTETQKIFAEAVKTAKTVVWNGPMGVFENPVLAKGTIAVAKALAETDATTIIGGGDSAAAVIQLGFADKMSHISTGGGASLEYLEGKVLPGVAVIAEK